MDCVFEEEDIPTVQCDGILYRVPWDETSPIACKMKCQKRCTGYMAGAPECTGVKGQVAEVDAARADTTGTAGTVGDTEDQGRVVMSFDKNPVHVKLVQNILTNFTMAIWFKTDNPDVGILGV